MELPLISRERQQKVTFSSSYYYVLDVYGVRPCSYPPLLFREDCRLLYPVVEWLYHQGYYPTGVPYSFVP